MNFSGCDVNAKKKYRKEEDDDFSSPVHMAVAWGQTEVLKALVKAGANLNVQVIVFRFFLFFYQTREITVFIFDMLAVCQTFNYVNGRLSFESTKTIQFEDSDGRTACHVAVREKHHDALKELLAAEDVTFVSMRDKFGHTTLSQAIANRDHEVRLGMLLFP